MKCTFIASSQFKLLSRSERKTEAFSCAQNRKGTKYLRQFEEGPVHASEKVKNSGNIFFEVSKHLFAL